jgi:hypothetical protein
MGLAASQGPVAKPATTSTTAPVAAMKRATAFAASVAPPGLTAAKSCECGAAAGLSMRCPSCEGLSLSSSRAGRAGAAPAPPPAAFDLSHVSSQPSQAATPLRLQTQLRVSTPGDSTEVEAQEIGRRVVRMAEPTRPAAISRGAGRNLVQRRAIAPRMTSAPVARDIAASRGGGAPLPAPVRTFMEPRFAADFSNVRVHTGARATELSNQLNAHAFTIGRDIYFNDGQFKPETSAGRELIAHELAHTIQQGEVVQRAEAQAPVAERARPSVQRSIWDDIKSGVAGIVNALGDPLAFLADKANMIPGFRMLTIVIGANPISMAKVDPTPANILMALIEFIPGGGLVTQALQNSGVFDKVGNWIAAKVKELASTAGALKSAVTTFIGSLKVSDIADPGGVWDRAKRIFTEPIDRLIGFCKGVITDILKFIKDAILIPLAKLAEGTPSWDLLCAVLGNNPVTGEAVDPNPTVLIGGFMKLIGQEEVWQNMQKANAIPRAFAWFKGAVSAVKTFVTAIPGKFKELFTSLTIEDVVGVAGAFKKVVSVFGGFVANFISWGLDAVWKLLELIFDVVSPGAFEYVQKTGAALKSILKNPLPFVGNLIAAAKLGFTNFAANIGEHLKEGLIDWLTGSLPGVYIPKAVSLPEFGKLALSVLGISWAQIRGKIVKALGPPGETIMKGLELAFDVVKALVTGGVAAAWELIKEKLTGLKDMVVDAIIGFVKSAIIEKAIPKLIAMFIPGAGFISAILSIYDTIKVFIDKLAKIAAVVKSFVDSIVAIAAGQIGGAASRVEGALSGLLSLAISFFAGFAGLSDVASKIRDAIKKVQDMVDKGLDTAIAWIIVKAKALFASLFGAKDKDGKDKKAGDAVRPEVAVPFGMASQSHELTFEPKGDDVEIDMASANKLPLTTKFQEAHVAIDNFRAYMTSVTDPTVKSDFETNILPKIQALQAPQVAEFKATYNRLFPKPDPSGNRPPPLISDAQAKANVDALRSAAQKLLSELSAWGVATGIDDLSRGAVDKTLQAKGDAIWRASWEKVRAQILNTISGFNYKGAKISVTGSASSGWKGPHKGQLHFDPGDFDVDLYTVHPAEFKAAQDRGAKIVFGKIFPQAEAPDLMKVSGDVVAALTSAFPGVVRVTSSAVVLRAS